VSFLPTIKQSMQQAEYAERRSSPLNLWITEDRLPALPKIGCIDTDAQAYHLLPAYSLIRALYHRCRVGGYTPQEAFQKVMVDWREFWREDERATVGALR